MKMKKLIIAMAFAAITATGFTAAAKTDKKCGKQECTRTEQCAKAAKCGKQACDSLQCFAARPCEFEGLNLTDAQKTQIQAIKAEQRTNAQAAKAAKQQAKADRRAAKEAARTEYLAKVKEVLTPEQYVQYLENIAKQQPAKQGKKMQGRRPEDRGPRQAVPRRAQVSQQ